jgi:hypothetical protein
MTGLVILVQKGQTPMIVVVEADDAVEKLKSLENIIRNLKSPRNPGVNSLDLFFFI